MYLIDTNVVSELRRPRPHGAVVQWIESVDDDALSLSAVTLGELQAGIEKTREQDPERAGAIEAWVDQLAQTWNVLPADAAVFRLAARLMHRRQSDLAEDALIAATAITNNLIVATRNTKDFARLDVRTFNPFQFGRR